MTIPKPTLPVSFLKINSEMVFLAGSILSSFGILLVTVGGSWDITNHLLNNPETFFSPPHALMYFGVAISLFGGVFSFLGWKNLLNHKNHYFVSLKFKLIGIALLTGAGPFDFVWHSNFGLDGLLSPPHITLILGMFLCSIGGMIGISRYLKFNDLRNSIPSSLTILAILPVWLSGSGIISSLSLPFSNTDYFEFNPEPTFAFVLATLAFPFLISLSMLLVFRLSNFRFGMITLLSALFLLISSFTSIVPNFAIVESIQFYSLNLIPFLISDVILLFDKSKKSIIFAGGLLGSIFYIVYYPYVLYTFNDVLLGKLVSPSLIYFVYFEIIQDVLMLTFAPAVLMGILAALLSTNLSKKILMNKSDSV
ncbi:hypothetical protein [Nitrosopumilus sp.]|uniref:hypothetical protein n=1 Tax=Nitrosopumilus sp. TaxID=2024843 RepID=UPI00292E65D0|nr:hypothetical protein [Nitrosopumilus sp.]